MKVRVLVWCVLSICQMSFSMDEGQKGSQGMAQTLYKKGLWFCEKHDYDTAAVFFKASIKKSRPPQKAVGQLALACVQDDGKEAAETLVLLSEVTKQSVHLVAQQQAYYFLGCLHLRHGNKEESFSCLAQAMLMQQHPYVSGKAQLLMGALLAKENQWGHAYMYFKGASENGDPLIRKQAKRILAHFPGKTDK